MKQIIVYTYLKYPVVALNMGPFPPFAPIGTLIT